MGHNPSSETEVISVEELFAPVPSWTAKLETELHRFYATEAALIDLRAYSLWLDLFSDDTEYWAPLRSNTLTDEATSDLDTLKTGFFLDSKMTLSWRVRQFETGRHWAEDPPSRTRHLVTNLIIAKVGAQEEDPVEVVSNFLVYRNRLETESDIWVGARRDRLERSTGPASFRISRRKVILDQAVVLSKNLSVFF